MAKLSYITVGGDMDKLTQLAIDKEIGDCFNRLYDLLELSERIEAVDCSPMVTEAKAIWEGDESSFDNQRL